MLNTMSESLVVWKPVSDQPNELFIDPVSVTGDGIELLMSSRVGAKEQLRINFDYCPSIRIHTEHVYNRTELMKAWGQSNFWIIENSDHAQWLRERTSGIYDQEYTNYLIFTAEDCIDLLHVGEPSVEWVDAGDSAK